MRRGENGRASGVYTPVPEHFTETIHGFRPGGASLRLFKIVPKRFCEPVFNKVSSSAAILR